MGVAGGFKLDGLGGRRITGLRQAVERDED
jgi:hypothetical protein